MRAEPTTSVRGDAVVVAVEDTVESRRELADVARRAAATGATVHVVASHELRDSWKHRRDRLDCPGDVAHALSPRGDAEAIARDAARRCADLGAAAVIHLHHGSRANGVRQVAAALAAPARTAARGAAPVPAVVPGTAFARRSVTVAGARMSYCAAGSGPVLLLVHGLFDSALTWRHVAEPLSARFTVLAPDLLGHGASAAPRGADYSLDGHAERLRAFLDAVGHERVTVAGHSMGGGIAMAFAAAHPERVDAIAVLATGGFGREVHGALRLAAAPGASLALALLATPPVYGLLRAGARLSRSRATSVALREAAGTLRRLRTRGARRAALATLRAVVGPGGQRVSALERLGEVAELPMLILWGARDGLIPVAHGVAGHEARAGSRMVVLEGVGHHPHIARAGVVADTLATFAGAGAVMGAPRFERPAVAVPVAAAAAAIVA